MSVSAGTALASAVLALYFLLVIQVCLGHTTDAAGPELTVTLLDALEAAELLVARFLPLGDELGIAEALCNQILIQLAADDFPLVEELEDVARPLVVQAVNGPQDFGLPLAFRVGIDGRLDLKGEFL